MHALTSGGALPELGAAWRTRNIGYLLFAATGHLVRDKLGMLHRGGFALSEAQLTLFYNMDRNGTRLTAIAARANLTKQSMIELVDRAEALGHVERNSDPDDKRAKVVVFTVRGLHVLDHVDAAVTAAEQRVADAVGERFLTVLKSSLGAYAARNPDIDAGRSDAAWRSERVGRVFALASRRFVHDVLSAVRERGVGDIAEVLLPLFRNLDINGTRLTAIAARARMTKQSMRELVDRAEALGLVHRRPDAADRRAKTVMFTATGLAMLDEIRLGVARAEESLGREAGQEFFAELRVRLTAYVAMAEDGENTRSDRIAQIAGAEFAKRATRRSGPPR